MDVENIPPEGYNAQSRKGLGNRSTNVTQVGNKHAKQTKIPTLGNRVNVKLAVRDQTSTENQPLVDAQCNSQGLTGSPMDVDQTLLDKEKPPTFSELNLSETPRQLNELPDLELVFRDVHYYSDSLRAWKSMEARFIPGAKYMRKQKELDWDMRRILIDWLVEVCEEFKLHNETLHLAVSYLDRFLSIMSCARERLQLAGVAAMFIASKYEEIYPPSASDFVNLTDNTYTTRQLFRMEISMLKALSFKLTSPNANAFLMDFLNCPDRVHATTERETFQELENLCQYICELTLLDGETYLAFKPSQIAASVLYVASHTLGLTDWANSVPEKSSYNLDQIQACIRFVHKTFLVMSKNPEHRAIWDKYSDEDRFGRTVTIVPPMSFPLQF